MSIDERRGVIGWSGRTKGENQEVGEGMEVHTVGMSWVALVDSDEVGEEETMGSMSATVVDTVTAPALDLSI